MLLRQDHHAADRKSTFASVSKASSNRSLFLSRSLPYQWPCSLPRGSEMRPTQSPSGAAPPMRGASFSSAFAMLAPRPEARPRDDADSGSHLLESQSPAAEVSSFSRTLRRAEPQPTLGKLQESLRALALVERPLNQSLQRFQDHIVESLRPVGVLVVGTKQMRDMSLAVGLQEKERRASPQASSNQLAELGSFIGLAVTIEVTTNGMSGFKCDSILTCIVHRRIGLWQQMQALPSFCRTNASQMLMPGSRQVRTRSQVTTTC